MLKKWTLGMVLLTTSLCSQAGLITQPVDATDMAGIEVTATFSDGATQTQIWSALTATVGGVENDMWSLKIEGDTFGDFDKDTSTFYGLWTLVNKTADFGITGLTINAGLQGFYFDMLNGPSNAFPNGTIGTPGSGPGREFAASPDDGILSATYDDQYSASYEDLWGKLNISWTQGNSLASNQSIGFLTDTDRATATVPEPATMFTFALGLIALVCVRKKSTGK